MSGKEITIFKNILLYSSSQYFRQFLGVITAFVRPALLSPHLFGLWSLFKVIETYADYLHLGSFSSMRYQIPFHESQKKYSTVNSIIGSVFRGSFYLYLIFSTLLVSLSFIPGISFESRIGFIAFALIILLIWYNNFQVALLKARSQFLDISKLNYIYYITAFVLNIVLIYFWGIYGAYLSIIIPLIVMDLILKKKFALEKIDKFQKKVFTGMIKEGFPIMLYNTAAFFIRTCDRFIVAFFLGTQQLGYYGIAILILGFLLNIPGASRDVLDPHMMKAFTQTSTEEIIKKYFIAPLMNTAYFMPVVIGGAYFCLPEVIALLLPEYVNGIVAAQIVTIGGYFIGLSYTARGIIVANKWQGQAPMVMIVPLIVNIVLSIVLIKAGFGIAGVAVASTFSYFILVLSLFSFVAFKENYIAKLLCSNMFYIWLPFLVLNISIYILEKSLVFPSIHSYFVTILKLFIFLLIFSILIFKTKNKHTLVQKIDYNTILRKIF